MSVQGKRINSAVALPAAELRNVQTLKPYPHNARTHSKRQIEQIARSIERFGFLNPVLIDASGTIIAGHGRVEAAKLLGLAQVPTLRIEHLSDEEKRAYILADNKLAEKAGWDREILAIELQALVDMGFEIELTGCEMADVDFILDEATEIKQAPLLPEDSIPELMPLRSSISKRLGGLFIYIPGWINQHHARPPSTPPRFARRAVGSTQARAQCPFASGRTTVAG